MSKNYTVLDTKVVLRSKEQKDYADESGMPLDEVKYRTTEVDTRVDITGKDKSKYYQLDDGSWVLKHDMPRSKKYYEVVHNKANYKNTGKLTINGEDIYVHHYRVAVGSYNKYTDALGNELLPISTSHKVAKYLNVDLYYGGHPAKTNAFALKKKTHMLLSNEILARMRDIDAYQAISFGQVSGGYRRSAKTGYFYKQHITLNDKEFVGYGISNQVDDRLWQYRVERAKTPGYQATVNNIWVGNANDIAKAESEIKRNFNRYIKDRASKSGFRTESAPWLIHEKIIDQVMKKYGFKQVNPVDYGVTSLPDYLDLDLGSDVQRKIKRLAKPRRMKDLGLGLYDPDVYK